MHYTTVNYTTLYYTILNYTTLNYTKQHSTTDPNTAVQYNVCNSTTQAYSTLPYIMLPNTELLERALHYTFLQCLCWGCSVIIRCDGRPIYRQARARPGKRRTSTTVLQQCSAVQCLAMQLSLVQCIFFLVYYSVGKCSKMKQIVVQCSAVCS